MTSVIRQAMLESFLLPGEPTRQTPVDYAELMGATYAASRDEAHRNRNGLYLTHPVVAGYMAGMIRSGPNHVRLLDPAAGAGILLCAAIERLVDGSAPPTSIEVVAYEIDEDLCSILRQVLDHSIHWAARFGVNVRASIHAQDFILANAAALQMDSDNTFDAVIMNPPYFKIGKDDPRAVAASTLVHGQPNIYGLFMAVGAALVRPGGDFISITPRSFASGPYFKLVRERFLNDIRPVGGHVFGSRRDAFSRDDVLQENVILHGIRETDWMHKRDSDLFTMSSSVGVGDLGRRLEWQTPLTELIDSSTHESVFRLPSSPEDGDVLAMVDSWTGRLRDYGMEISTGPVVAFRATEWLSNLASESTMPLLWMNHVHAMSVRWPAPKHKAQHFRDRPESRRLLLPNRNYVVLRRFSAKEEPRRLTAAPWLAELTLASFIGLENHLNYIYRPGGELTIHEIQGLAGLLNSKPMDTYFRCINGNTQVGATELRNMPLPPLESIVALGSILEHEAEPMARIDELVWDLIHQQSSQDQKPKDTVVA